jgi:hypothetical protein
MFDLSNFEQSWPWQWASLAKEGRFSPSLKRRISAFGHFGDQTGRSAFLGVARCSKFPLMIPSQL